MVKESARYKKGFREGYNNPNQHSNLNLSKATDEYSSGIIAGVVKRRMDIANGINEFIWSDEDLKKKLVKV